MDNCWPSAATRVTPASTSGTSAAGRWPSMLQGHTGEIIGAQFAHSGYLLATSSWDGTTRLWDAASGEPLAMAPGSLHGSFAPDDRRLAFRCGGTIGVWDVAVAPECRTLHPGMLGNRSEARGRDRGAGGGCQPRRPAGGDRRRGWRPPLGGRHGPRAGPSQGRLLRDRAVSPRRPKPRSAPAGGACIAGRSGPIPIAGRTQSAIGPPELLREPAGRRVAQATWLPDHRTLALIDNANARVLLVDSSHPHPAWSRATALDSGENHRMTSVAVSPDGRWLAVGGWKEAGVRVWDLRRAGSSAS